MNTKLEETPSCFEMSFHDSDIVVVGNVVSNLSRF